MKSVRESKSYLLFSLVLALALSAVWLIPLSAAAQICPIETAAGLPPQTGHPWTKLASCVSGGSAVVGGQVDSADCTNAYVGSAQMLRGDGALGTITIQSGGTLVFLDQSYAVQVGSIVVQSGGTLQIGAKACPIHSPNEVRIFFSAPRAWAKGSMRRRAPT
jgi:hypothetical protein